MLHIVNTLHIPVTWVPAKALPSWIRCTGRHDIQCVCTGITPSAFFLDGGWSSLACSYYFCPVRAGRPIWSYRLSDPKLLGHSCSFTCGAGSHHLHYHCAALLGWQTLGDDIPRHCCNSKRASAGKCHRSTLNGACAPEGTATTPVPALHVRGAAVVLRAFHIRGVVLAIPSVQRTLAVYTDWTVGHVPLRNTRLGGDDRVRRRFLQPWLPSFAAATTWLAQGRSNGTFLRLARFTEPLITLVSLWNAGHHA